MACGNVSLVGANLGSRRSRFGCVCRLSSLLLVGRKLFGDICVFPLPLQVFVIANTGCCITGFNFVGSHVYLNKDCFSNIVSFWLPYMAMMWL